jgi:hypothetical protein
MNSEVVIVSRTVVDWPLLRKTVSQVTGLRPSEHISQSPVTFTEQAEALIFAAYLYLDTPSATDPHKMLSNLPRECLDFLHYTFLIGCDRDVVDDLREKTRAHYSMVDVGRGYCILGTGGLSVWYDAIVLNLTNPNMALKSVSNTRLLLDKLLLLLCKEGLHALFSQYTRKQLPDRTFLLEG